MSSGEPGPCLCVKKLSQFWEKKKKTSMKSEENERLAFGDSHKVNQGTIKY